MSASVVIDRLEETEKSIFMQFAFADSESCKNAKIAIAACLSLPGERCFPKAFLVVGPCRSGKTMFVHRLLRLFSPDVLSTPVHRGPNSWRGSEFRGVALTSEGSLLLATQKGYLFLDNAPHCSLSDEILNFLTHPNFSYRQFHSNEIKTVRNNCVIFITSTQEEIGAEWHGRVRLIQMKGGE